MKLLGLFNGIKKEEKDIKIGDIFGSESVCWEVIGFGVDDGPNLWKARTIYKDFSYGSTYECSGGELVYFHCMSSEDLMLMNLSR